MIRIFMPGSEWLFCKIYTGENEVEFILKDCVYKLVNDLRGKGIIDKWFFIRYKDSMGFHLRLRFHIPDISNVFNVILVVNEYFSPFVNNDVAIVQYDTYIRELERYGAELIEETESLFCMDSDWVLNAIKISDYQGEGDRWKFALSIMDGYLDEFGFSTKSKQIFSSLRRDAYRKEFGFDKAEDIRQIDKKYREMRILINNLLDNTKQRQKELVLRELANKIGHSISSVDLTDYLASVLHMSMNRLFIENNRFNEMMIFDFLSRYYESLLARQKYSLG